jgi:hypothetical protein
MGFDLVDLLPRPAALGGLVEETTQDRCLHAEL